MICIIKIGEFKYSEIETNVIVMTGEVICNAMTGYLYYQFLKKIICGYLWLVCGVCRLKWFVVRYDHVIIQDFEECMFLPPVRTPLLTVQCSFY